MQASLENTHHYVKNTQSKTACVYYSKRTEEKKIRLK